MPRFAYFARRVDIIAVFMVQRFVRAPIMFVYGESCVDSIAIIFRNYARIKPRGIFIGVPGVVGAVMYGCAEHLT